MDNASIALVRQLLSGSAWLEHGEEFAATVRHAPRDPGGLLLIGTPDEEPWHLAAHLDDEARRQGLPRLSPTLVRHAVPLGAPPHLSFGLDRLEASGRGEALLVVAGGEPPATLLERVHDARGRGAVVLALEQSAPELAELSHDALEVPLPDPSDPRSSLVTLDTAQHLVSMAAGEASDRGSARRGLRSRLARLLDTISGPTVERW